MSPRAPWRTSLTVLAAVSLTVCTGESDGARDWVADSEDEASREPEGSSVPTEERSKYLCLEAGVPDTFCAANVEILDAQVEFISAYLGLPLPVECVPTLWSEDVSADCGPHKGCYRDGVIRSTWQTMSHEIVHAIVDNAGLKGSVFMWEGLAEALSGKVLRGRGMGLEAILAVGAEGSLSGAEYESAGHLLSWMLEYLGPEIVVGIYDRLERDMHPAEVVGVLEEFSGMSFAALEEAYAAAQSTIYAGRGPFSCGAAAGELGWMGDRADEEAKISCGSGRDYRRMDLMPSLGHTEELWRPYTLDLPGGEVRVELGEPLSTHALLQACLVEDTDESLLPAPPQPVLRSWDRSRGEGFFGWSELPEGLSLPGGVVLDLPAGSYTFWIGRVRGTESITLTDQSRSFSLER